MYFAASTENNETTIFFRHPPPEPEPAVPARARRRADARAAQSEKVRYTDHHVNLQCTHVRLFESQMQPCFFDEKGVKKGGRALAPTRYARLSALPEETQLGTRTKKYMRVWHISANNKCIRYGQEEISDKGKLCTPPFVISFLSQQVSSLFTFFVISWFTSRFTFFLISFEHQPLSILFGVFFCCGSQCSG